MLIEEKIYNQMKVKKLMKDEILIKVQLKHIWANNNFLMIWTKWIWMNWKKRVKKFWVIEKAKKFEEKVKKL